VERTKPTASFKYVAKHFLLTHGVHRTTSCQTANCKFSCNEKKRLEETQTLHAGCSKAEPTIFAPPRDPLPGGAGRPKFNQLQMVTTFT